jgi:hypothetical protein
MPVMECIGITSIEQYVEARDEIQIIRSGMDYSSNLSQTDLYALCTENGRIDTLKGLYEKMQHSRIDAVFLKALSTAGLMGIDTERTAQFADRFMQEPIYLRRLIDFLGYEHSNMCDLNLRIANKFYFSGKAVTGFVVDEEYKRCRRMISIYKYGKRRGVERREFPYIKVLSDSRRVRMMDDSIMGEFLWT